MDIDVAEEIKDIDVAGVSRRAAGELGRIRKREKES